MNSKWIVIKHYMATRYGRRYKSRHSLEQWQEHQITTHLDWVRQHSPFYRELWKDIPTSLWRSFPIIDKKLMMNGFDQLNTAGITKKEAFELALMAEQTRDFQPSIHGITVGLSSGTSGNRGIFLVGEQERYAWAGTVLAKVLPKSLLHSERIAFFLRADSNLYGSVSGGRLQFEFYDLLDDMEQHITRLNTYKPTLLIAPASLLRMLADAMMNKQLKITPTKVISVAEVLDPLDRLRIEEAFHQKVHQIYQCTEGFLAATCSHGTLHLNEDIVHIEKEYVDRKLGKFVPIITDFTRSTQPIIRYRLDDILTEQAQCPCGSQHTALSSIEGRCDDVFYFKDISNSSLIPVFPDFLSRVIVHSSSDVEDYTMIQWDTHHIEIALRVPTLSIEKAQMAITIALNQLCHKLACEAPTISFTEYTDNLIGRKLRRIERRYEVDGLSPVTGNSIG
ncbi:putative adenylate-forming enzyme [Paenibacillus sp. DS2015]|uniref:F390 synthetase-related protein n=1 Tax=Paenibacillus sp. DS2015 TaxID=3373917 RepID=UPI003D1F254C